MVFILYNSTLYRVYNPKISDFPPKNGVILTIKPGFKRPFVQTLRISLCVYNIGLYITWYI